MGDGIGEIAVEDYSSSLEGTILKEVIVVKDADLTQKISLGIIVDPIRNRLLPHKHLNDLIAGGNFDPLILVRNHPIDVLAKMNDLQECTSSPMVISL
ncbi:unnamed protein product [Dovyalis caffra]|uniref:Uncharacterized protein n=1 Tax=Dovyalis caffra TaxID=77055 RepID=A0AAV1SW51_9ROSI|nr:unnamed protein product [Dovyalis caffra]